LAQDARHDEVTNIRKQKRPERCQAFRAHAIMRLIIGIVIAIAATALATSTCIAGEVSNIRPSESLEQSIRRLDGEVFDAFNRCSDPAQLDIHASYFATNVEFYHDNGGVTWNRADMLANTRKNACGHYTRKLIPDSIAVYPIKDFGAIELGSHRFCQVETGKCEGVADFVMIWHQASKGWEITRVLSYGHRAAVGGS
jgi:hypothetical protein